MPPPRDVLAAGAVVFRPGRQVLLVHRPRYDDWAFPKGKLDPGEHRTAAAVREVAEETGLRIRLGVPLDDQRYSAGGRMKTVHYWVARVVGDDDVSGYAVNDEIDEVSWVDVDQAPSRLTYRHDHDTLAEALRARRRTVPFVVLRHGTAVPRREWDGDDRLRPLLPAGHDESERLVPLLAAYDVQRVLTSSSTRCTQSVAPYVTACGVDVVPTDALSQEDADPEAVRRAVADLEAAAGGRGVLLCTHRPVLPAVFAALGVPDPRLEKGAALVVHRRKRATVAAERLP